MDDVLIFCIGMVRDTNNLQEILDLFSKATRMEINSRKSTLSAHLLRVKEMHELNRIFPFNLARLDSGLKYVGFC